jgi:hypothetical protein
MALIVRGRTARDRSPGGAAEEGGVPSGERNLVERFFNTQAHSGDRRALRQTRQKFSRFSSTEDRP